MLTVFKRSIAAVFVLAAFAWPLRADEAYAHLVIGNPSGATADEGKPDNYLVKMRQYALSYNNGKGTPNWVAWVRHEVADVNVLRAED